MICKFSFEGKGVTWLTRCWLFDSAKTALNGFLSYEIMHKASCLKN